MPDLVRTGPLTSDEPPNGPLIGVIDSGTKCTQFLIYKPHQSVELTGHSIEITHLTPKEGWLEIDPREILTAINKCVVKVKGKLKALGYDIKDVVTLGIANQRETTIVWDRTTGKPLYNAIEWSDIRTDNTVNCILDKVPDNNKNYYRAMCGLPISPYFSAFKLKWLKDNIPLVRKRCKDGKCLFGTVDTWIVWNLTGACNGGVHVTDVTNASRTFLMNISTLNWDPTLLKAFDVGLDVLPEIRSSSEVYGTVKDWPLLEGMKISGILGNQQAALVGQGCLNAGQAKNTYRSGCFLLYNTGPNKVISSHGLVTTVAYKMGPNAPTIYALEGSVAVAGQALSWLRDNIGLIKNVQTDAEELAKQVATTGDVYFVPAFKGLYAPYWRKDARGIICGLTHFTSKAHVIRAALESVCFQTRDIIEAMNKDCGSTLNRLHVDGIMTRNELLMQLQADISGVPVLRATTPDITGLGAAIVAGQADGIDLWHLNTPRDSIVNDTFLPTTTSSERDARYAKWKMAVQRSLGWVTVKRSIAMTDDRYRLLASIPPSFFVFGSFILLGVSQLFSSA